MNEFTDIEFSACASLVALGVRFQKLNLWDVIKAHVRIKQKVRQHTPLGKLLDCFINILAGGGGLVEINTRVRPDRALQRAFGRSSCAEQSTISETLNACTPENVRQLRACGAQRRFSSNRAGVTGMTTCARGRCWTST
jgi:hypothetical protein